MIKEANLSVDNLKITGQLFWPDKGKGPFPGVILCHGVPSGRVDPNDGGYPLLAKTISEAGLAVYTFRFRGSGESQGNFDIGGWLRDLEAAVDYMQKAGEAQKSKLALVGFSAGAAVAICAAANDKRVTAVAACASPTDFSAISETDNPQYSVSYFRKIGIIRDDSFPPSLTAWLNDFRQVNTLKRVAQIAPRPLLLLHSEGDKVVAVGDSLKLFEKAGEPKQIRILAGDEHRLRKHEEAVKILIGWLKETFKNGEAAG
jgi:dipeptidyl aminopeptidase/acylaminoacyl peptidase